MNILITSLCLLIWLSACKPSASSNVYNGIEPDPEDGMIYVISKEASSIGDEFDAIFYPIVEPTYDWMMIHHGTIIERETDYEAILRYFCNNDFSEEKSKMLDIYNSIKDIPYDDPEFPRGLSSIRMSMREKLGTVIPLIEMGESFRGKEIENITKDDFTREQRICITALDSYRGINFEEYFDDYFE